MIKMMIRIMIRKGREGSAPDVICNQTLPQDLLIVAFYPSKWSSCWSMINDWPWWSCWTMINDQETMMTHQWECLQLLLCSLSWILMISCLVWWFHAHPTCIHSRKQSPFDAMQCRYTIFWKAILTQCCRSRVSESHHIFQNTLDLPSSNANICGK